MRKGDEKKKAAPPAAPAPVKAPEFTLKEVAREIARIQKKLGMDFSWYRG